ncbi:hypothetical protein KUCAC02_020030 [Chaenocephalus aceratus]|uniref:Uncharacterized protein n=1 Tax=Chaenocephalus aceratus TaxID=36190 RepID=A0ACB9VQD6_CHAAC|nr:hypothetical protein KUCAC02_020030 [Chaenocephalus aceratus]
MLSRKEHQPLIDTISENYQILKVLGAGCYGQVVECLKLDTEETVAVKVLKQKNSSKNNMKEVLILERLQCFDPDKSHIVRCHECFQSFDRTFLVFEMLDMSLHDYMNKRGRLPLPLKAIQMMIRDLATALDTLKGIGIIHSDLKMDNVMLVNHHVKPLKAVKISEVWPRVVMQPLWNRSPEIILGLPFNEAIDIWSLGTILAEMLLGFPLFPGRHEYDVLRYIIDLLDTQGVSDGNVEGNDGGKEYSFSSLDALKKLPLGFTEVQTDERTLEVGEAPKESSAIRTQAVQGAMAMAEIEQEWKLESISNEDWEIEIMESVMASDNTKAPSSSSSIEESLSSPVISQPRKGVRGFFSNMKRKSCFYVKQDVVKPVTTSLFL